MPIIIGIIYGVVGLWIMYEAFPNQIPGGYLEPVDRTLLTVGGAAICGGAILIYAGSIL